MGSEHITRGVDVRGLGARGYYGSGPPPRGSLRGQHEAAVRQTQAQGHTKGGAHMRYLRGGWKEGRI